MPRTIIEYHCLLISPSDVRGERDALFSVVDRWNAHVGRALGVRVTLVGWESHAVPDSRKPAQESLNTQFVDKCDFGVAVFWTRLGTETDRAESGSAEEIERLTERGAQVLIYFSEAPVPQECLKDDQFQRLLAFKQQLISRSLISTYADLDDLGEKVQLHITSVVADLLQTDRAQPIPTPVETAPVPDVRVVANASLVVPRDKAIPVLSVAAQNHSSTTVHITSITLECDDGTKAFLGRDAVLGTQQHKRAIAPGESYSFFYDLATLEDILRKRVGIVCAVATDAIGREYRSDPNHFRNVLKQLNVLEKGPV